MSEEDYIRGSKTAYRNMMIACMKELSDDENINEARLLAERDEAISRLREVCAKHGDNEWDDNLHLADIIEKHLWRYLNR